MLSPKAKQLVDSIGYQISGAGGSWTCTGQTCTSILHMHMNQSIRNFAEQILKFLISTKPFSSPDVSKMSQSASFGRHENWKSIHPL